MRLILQGKQKAIAESILLEMSSGMLLKDAVRAVMKSKQYNHMLVKRVAEKLEANPNIVKELSKNDRQ